MKNEEIRIAIAEHLGWINAGNKWKGFHCWSHPDGTARYGQKEDWLSCVPDYPSDLNACHEMEKVLTDEQCFTYFDYIAKTNGEGIHKQIFATAPQRCEAFLRCIGKWTDHPACNGTGEKEGRA